jgi:nucleoid-associated protein YgaU
MQYKMAKPLFDAGTPVMALAALTCCLLAGPTMAQNLITTEQQKATAAQVAQGGVALSELSPNAPGSYTVKSGDTLWGISSLFLKTAWRWPELWGMNLSDIKNPHRIYPGQTLFLETKDGRAVLRTRQAGADADEALPKTVRLSPRTRIEKLAPQALSALRNQLIEPFLAEPIIVDELSLNAAPRIVAAQDSRVLLTRGDRAYARGPAGSELQDDRGQKQKAYRVFRNATPLKDPMTGEVLGYEAQYVGKAVLTKSETTQSNTDASGKVNTEIVPATIDIVDAKEEMRVGDRLLPEPPQQLQSYVPHAPQAQVDARIVSVYGSAVINAAQNQVVTINRGTRDGVESGQVLAIMNDGARVVDKTDPTLPQLKLPDERNGLLMVFRPFEKLSYALVLDITSGVKVGDRLVNPR